MYWLINKKMIIKKRPNSSKFVSTNDIKSETGKEMVLNELNRIDQGIFV